MKATTVRCPNCLKKQEEPFPKRCGCGQSLLTVLAARGSAPGRLRVLTTAGGAGQPPADASITSGENEW